MKQPLYLLMAWLCAVTPLLAQKQSRFTLPTALFDLTNSTAQPGNIRIPLTETNINMELVDWAAAATPTSHQATFEIRLLKPTPGGSVLTYGDVSISYLSHADWKPLLLHRMGTQLLSVTPFPEGEFVEAIRASVTAKQRHDDQLFQATLPFLTLIPVRAVNLAGHATITASSAGKDGVTALRPAILADGIVDPRKNFMSAPRPDVITAAQPEWLVFQWNLPQKIRGMGIFRGTDDPGFGLSFTEIFTGHGNPGAAAGTNDWKVINGRATLPGAFRGNQLFATFENHETRALRIRTVGGVKQIGAGEIIILSDLGPVPPAPALVPLEGTKP